MPLLRGEEPGVIRSWLVCRLGGLALLLGMGCATHPQTLSPNEFDEHGTHRVTHEPGVCRTCDLFFTARRGVVQVRAASSLGAGVVVAEDGLVATNAHVVEPESVVILETVEGELVLGDVLLADATQDLALVRARASGVDWLVLGAHSGDRPRVGSLVFLIGHPLGLGWTVTRGMISGERDIGGAPATQIDAGISPGNSGGPVLDEDGRLVGIVMSKLQGGGAESIAFARPVEAMEALIEAARNRAVVSPSARVQASLDGSGEESEPARIPERHDLLLKSDRTDLLPACGFPRTSSSTRRASGSVDPLSFSRRGVK